DVVPGYYVYVGSAFGPGGVRARVLRYCRKSKPKHWHIDYLREFLRPVGAWYSYDTERLEHRWAQAFGDMAGMSSISGFGCSDCKCDSRLFTVPGRPDIGHILAEAGSQVESWSLLRETRPPPRVAKKPLTHRLESEGFNRIRCPLCRWQPKALHRWLCAPCDDPEFFDDGCGACWNTFSTRGRCPGCGHQWRWTACLNCAGWSLHTDWYAKESERPN
ncbi:MAG TPA: GIY-YIG nuclease family protein, partial [Candidatus Limnocylindria bacterium]|nr:GIY-YIG nuclease family protein [Candidatus Limnocylindria bacterium]